MTIHRVALLGCVAALAGCTGLDPELRPGEWHPSGANEANLAVMVANPADLAHGASSVGADGPEAVAAVARLRDGKVKALPDSGLAELQLQANGNQAGGGGN